MQTLVLVLIAVFLTGCTSLQSAGVAEYSVKPIVIDNQAVCCEILVKNGKEYASLKAHIQKTGDNYTVDLEEQTVQAFAGQSTTAGVVKNAVESAATLGATAIGGALGTGLKAVSP